MPLKARPGLEFIRWRRLTRIFVPSQHLVDAVKVEYNVRDPGGSCIGFVLIKRPCRKEDLPKVNQPIVAVLREISSPSSRSLTPTHYSPSISETIMLGGNNFLSNAKGTKLDVATDNQTKSHHSGSGTQNNNDASGTQNINHGRDQNLNNGAGAMTVNNSKHRYSLFTFIC